MELSTFYNHILTAARQNNVGIEKIAEKLMKEEIYGIEFLLKTYTEENLKNIATLRSLGMYVNSIPAHTDLIHGCTLDYIDDLIRKAINVGTNKIMLIPGFLNEGEDRDYMIERAFDRMFYLCGRAADYGIEIGIEDYGDPTSPVLNSEGMLKFLEEHDNLTCTFDTGNFMFSGEDTLSAYNKLKHRITKHVHLKDHQLKEKECEGTLVAMDGTVLYPCAIGEGVVPNYEIIKDLKERNFIGAFTIEIFGSSDMLNDITKSANFIKDTYWG